MKIGAKLTAILVLMAMAGIILTALISYVVARKGIIEKIENHLESVVVLKGDHLKKYVEEKIGNLDHMTRDKLYREVFLGASRQKIRGVLKETLAHKKDLVELFTLNLDGVVDVSTDERQEGKIKSYEKYFIEGKKGPFLQSLYYDLSLQVPSMTISAPIRDEQGGLSGLLVGRVNLKKISSLMTDRIGLGKTGETYLVNMSNFMVTESRFEKGVALNKFVSTEGIRDCLKGNSERRMYVNYMGTPVLGYYEWIPETRACLLGEISEKEAFASISRLRNILAFVTIGVVILLIIFGFFFSKTISKPLETLIRGIERIGKGDLEHRVDVRGKDEIGKLALAFNHLTERRQEAEEALRKAHDESEQRVEERTSELVREIEERKQAEEALRESEEKYRSIFENVIEGIFQTTLEGRYISANPALARIHGYNSPEDLMESVTNVGRQLYVDSEQREEYLRLLNEKGFIENFEAQMYRKDGSKIWVSLNARAVRDDSGNVRYFTGILEDITEHKHAEEALRESENRFKLAAESSTDLIYEWDIKERIDWFGKIDELLGYSPSEFPRTIEAWANSVHPEDRDRVMAALKNHLEKNELYSIEYRVRRKDGTYNYWWARGSAVRDEKGNPYRWVGAITDVTERKKVEKALRESEEKYRTILENIEEGYFEVDIAGNFTFFNDSLCQILGYSRDEMMGMNNRQYTDNKNAQKLYQAFNKVYSTGEPAKEFDWEIIRKDGTKRYIEASVSLIKDISGQPIGFRGIVRNITERKRAEKEMAEVQEQLRQSQKFEAIGQLAGGVAHDFNNLLTVIKGYNQLSLLEVKEDYPLRINMEAIARASEKASDLIRQLLAFSRSQVMEMKVIDLNMLITDLDTMLRRVIGEDIELTIQLAEDLGRVKTDSGQIEQVILNLAINARDAMSSGGKLTIETANKELDEEYAQRHVPVKPGRYVMFSVSDTGVGMTPEVKNRVFEPFFTTKEVGKGTGLGLSTVYGIVKQSKGNIWAYSEPGRGTTFKIYLPRVDEPLKERSTRVLGGESPRGHETVLTVEDEEEVRKLTVQILKRQGYTVLEASHGEEAINVAKGHAEEGIDLLLTDVVMSGMSGRELAEKLGSLLPKMKVIYMSGYTDDAIVRHGVLEGGVNYLQKPFTLDSLARKVRDVLDQ